MALLLGGGECSASGGGELVNGIRQNVSTLLPGVVHCMLVGRTSQYPANSCAELLCKTLNSYQRVGRLSLTACVAMSFLFMCCKIDPPDQFWMLNRLGPLLARGDHFGQLGSRGTIFGSQNQSGASVSMSIESLLDPSLRNTHR